MGVRRIGGVLAVVAVLTAACSTSPGRQPTDTPTSTSSTAVAAAPTTSAASTPSIVRSTPSSTSPRREQRAATIAMPPPKPKSATTQRDHSTSSAHRLPLGYATGSATQVITVVASSTGSTTATLQAWRQASGGWYRVGPAVLAHLGSDGLSTHPSESRSATPIGSFTLTRAFGHDADPGTALPYTHTTPSDWWISQAGPLYNTRQRCSSGCAFTRGNPNEHLYYETPYYNHAIVIDYNTRNAPGGVRAGAGSAFFLHVTDGAPTAGCVAVAADQVVRLLRWLSPSAHPRILLGVS